MIKEKIKLKLKLILEVSFNHLRTQSQVLKLAKLSMLWRISKSLERKLNKKKLIKNKNKRMIKKKIKLHKN